MQGAFPFIIWAEGFGGKLFGELRFGGGLEFQKRSLLQAKRLLAPRAWERNVHVYSTVIIYLVNRIKCIWNRKYHGQSGGLRDFVCCA